MEKICKKCGLSFGVSNDDLAFYQKIDVTAPTLCPDDRLQRRLAWRNDTNLFKRKCDFSGQELISMFPPVSKHKVYAKDIWWSDKWDALKYGRPFDFNRSFFEQFQELHLEVPYPHIAVTQEENSLYTNYTMANRNCYLCFAGNYLEDSFYCYNVQNSRDCGDCLFVYNSELSYECIHSDNCYNVNFALHAKNCRDSWFIEDCISVKNCFMCFNLQQKEYCIMNKQYSREEYFEKLKEYNLQTAEGLEKALAYFVQIRANFPKRENHNLQTENCTGEYILQSKNCHDCYIMAKGCEDCKYILNAFPALKDAYDCTYAGENASLMYECMASGANAQALLFCNLCFTACNKLYYCNFLTSCHDCFGCSNMTKQEYCILNKKYTKEEYEKLLPKIIEHMKKTGEWGEFFPAEMSPFDYSTTQAVNFFG